MGHEMDGVGMSRQRRQLVEYGDHDCGSMYHHSHLVHARAGDHTAAISLLTDALHFLTPLSPLRLHQSTYIVRNDKHLLLLKPSSYDLHTDVRPIVELGVVGLEDTLVGFTDWLVVLRIVVNGLVCIGDGDHNACVVHAIYLNVVSETLSISTEVKLTQAL